MALFKVFKGPNTAKILNPGAEGYITPSNSTDGYAYYDTSTRLFYIDADYNGTGTITRKAINAATAGDAGTAIRANITTTTNAIAKYNDTLGTFANTGVTIDGNNNVNIPSSSYIKVGNITIGGAD